jgi:putative DNA base modification enzyme with NMAD domain
MPVLCTYVLTKDTGLAPNPFWDWCTLAVCTPNHQGACLAEGDWIAGFTSKLNGHRLVFAMKVSERIHMNEYFHDTRFSMKKPNLRGTWQQRCGDNFYSQAPDGSWTQHRNRFHIGPAYLAKDTRNPYVFVARRFWYFGREAVPVPDLYISLVGQRGIRVNHPLALSESFIAWVQSVSKPGVRAMPSHNPDAAA